MAGRLALKVKPLQRVEKGTVRVMLSAPELAMRAQEIRFAAQPKKMNELRNKELADRAERDRIRAEQGDAADDADQKPADAASAADAAN